MDDETIGADQARRLRAGLQAAALQLETLWLHYFRLGGTVDQMEVEAYLHHALTLPGLQRDLLAQALGELTESQQIPFVPFTADYPAPGSSGETDEGLPRGPKNRDQQER